MRWPLAARISSCDRPIQIILLFLIASLLDFIFPFFGNNPRCYFGRVFFQFNSGRWVKSTFWVVLWTPTLHVQAPAVDFDIQLRWWWSRSCSGSSISFFNISIALSCHCHIRTAKPTADTTRGSLVAEFEGNIKSKWSSSHPCVRHLKVGSLFTVIGAENMHVERNRK